MEVVFAAVAASRFPELGSTLAAIQHAICGPAHCSHSAHWGAIAPRALKPLPLPPASCARHGIDLLTKSNADREAECQSA